MGCARTHCVPRVLNGLKENASDALVWTVHCNLLIRRNSHATVVAYLLSILRFLGLNFEDGSYCRPGSPRGDAFTKGMNPEPAVLPRVQIVLYEPVIRKTESDAQGASAIDRLPPRAYQLEVNAPCLYTAVAVNGNPAIQRNGRGVLSVWRQDWKFTNKIYGLLNSFKDEPEIFLTEDDRKWLKAMDCAFCRKVHHA
jgi:hypothetical protein